MFSEESKKKELLNFIKWKLDYRGDLPELLKRLDCMSYSDLREWAIRNDIID
jgi:hypothetical protein